MLVAGLVNHEGRRFPFGKRSRPRKPWRIGPQAQRRPTETVAGHVEGGDAPLLGNGGWGWGRAIEQETDIPGIWALRLPGQSRLRSGGITWFSQANRRVREGARRGVDFEEGDTSARMENGRRSKSARSARSATCGPMGGGGVGSHECDSSGNPPMTPWREGRAISQRES